MTEEQREWCYTARFPSMFNVAALRRSTGSRSALRKLAYYLLAALLPGLNCLAQQDSQSPWQAAAGDLVQQVLSRAGSPATVSLSFANLSSLTASEQSTIKQAIMTDFRNAGVRLLKADSAPAEVEITFSEDWQSYVWLVEVKQNSGSQVVIKIVPRPQPAGSLRTNTFSIKKNLIWQQENTMLDFYSDAQNLIVLEPDQVAIYGNDSGQWRLKQLLAVPHDSPWPRDLRGRLEVSGFQITGFLPGTLCTGTTTPPNLQCRSGDDPWMIDANSLSAFFAPTRNFFTGVLSGRPAGETAPFFTGASTHAGNSRQWVFAGTDGRARIFLNDLSATPIIVNDWGSNLAAVQSGCGVGWQILATTPGDLNRPDSLQAYEVEGRHAETVSPIVDFDGPVMALWPGDSAQNVHAVVQSLTTGKFEAWSISVTCN